MFDDYYDCLLPRYTAKLKMHMTEYCKTMISKDSDMHQCKVLARKLVLLKDLGWEEEVQSVRRYLLGKYPAKRMLKQACSKSGFCNTVLVFSDYTLYAVLYEGRMDVCIHVRIAG